MVAIAEKLLVNPRFDRSIVLRSPTPADTSAFSVYLKKMFSESYMNLNAPKNRHDNTLDSEHSASLQRQLDDEHGFLLAAFDGEEIVGTFNLKPETAPFVSHCAAFGMALLKRMQGKGLGHMLLEYGLAQAKNCGKTNITLHVRTHNASAIRLYERFGFRKVGTLEQCALVDGEFVDEFVYQKIL